MEFRLETLQRKNCLEAMCFWEIVGEKSKMKTCLCLRRSVRQMTSWICAVNAMCCTPGHIRAARCVITWWPTVCCCFMAWTQRKQSCSSSHPLPREVTSAYNDEDRDEVHLGEISDAEQQPDDRNNQRGSQSAEINIYVKLRVWGERSSWCEKTECLVSTARTGFGRKRTNC